MPKHMVFLKKKIGMERDAFIKWYETRHVPLICRVQPYFSDYRRNYVIEPSFGEAQVKIDVFTELWYESQTKIDELFWNYTETAAGPLIDADEEQFLDRTDLLLFASDEVRTPAASLRPRPSGHTGEPAVKLMLLMDRLPGMSPEAFRAYYEEKHIALSLSLLKDQGGPLFAKYARNYPELGSCVAIGSRSGPLAAPCDVVTEFGFWTETDWENYSGINSGEVEARLLENMSRFVNVASVRLVRVKEYVTFPAQAAA